MNDPYGPPGGGYPGSGYPGSGYPGYAPQQDYNQQRGYLQGGPVDFQGAIRQQLQNVFNFSGRASRSAFWFYVLGIWILGVVLLIINAVASSAALSVLIILVVCVAALSELSIIVRRLHDSDKSGWWIFIPIVPIIGSVVLLVFYCLPGTPGQNRFG